MIGCDKRTVNHWILHYDRYGNVDDNKRSGRPRITSSLQDNKIIRKAKEVKFTSPRQVRRQLKLKKVSARTIDRRLIAAGLSGRIAKKKHRYTEEEKRKRLSFANGYLNWTNKQWNLVLFSDEKKFSLGFNGQVWVRRPIGEELNSDYVMNDKSHQLKLNVWGCFSGGGMGYCYIFNENLDAKKLKKIIGENLLASAELLFPSNPPIQWYYLQDNDPKHTSGLIKTWFHNHGVTDMDFPPYSPDLNPTENLWNDLARRIEERCCTSIEKLQDAIAEEWEKTNRHFIKSLANSMHNRCQAVIACNGDHTRY